MGAMQSTFNRHSLWLLAIFILLGAPPGCSKSPQPSPAPQDNSALCLDKGQDLAQAVTYASACAVDEDCATVRTACGADPDQCYAAINASTTAVDDFEALTGDFEGAGCGQECACGAPPRPICLTGICVLGDTCGGRAEGEIWLAPDNCNTCVCTADRGEVCTDEPCVDPCEGLPLPQCPSPCRADDLPGSACQVGAACGGPSGLSCTCTDEGTWACEQLSPPFVECNRVCEPAPERSCQELDALYQETIEDNAACQSDQDCRVVDGQCALGLGRCYEAVSVTSNVTQPLELLGQASYQASCQSQDDCECGPPPPVSCQEGACTLTDFCPGRALGETWAQECNTCVCTVEGQTCTNDPCDDTCEGLPTCPDACPMAEPQDEPCGEVGLECGNPQGLRCECVGEDTPAWDCRQQEPPSENCQETCQEAEPDCEDIQAAYTAQVEGAAACQSDDQCQWLFGQCGLGLGGCYEVVNTDLSQQALGGLGADHLAGGCGAPSCEDCGAPPEVACQQGRCVEVEPCPGRALGDEWTLEDGCTQCTCTQDGPVCSDAACPDVCEEIEVAYNALVDNALSCQSDADCQILNGHCGVGDCLVYVNQSLEQGQLNVLQERYREAGCAEMFCHCLLPYEVACASGSCKPVF